MFWIYGGAYEEGMNWGPLNLYDGTEIAAVGFCLQDPLASFPASTRGLHTCASVGCLA
jgi:hypothetical protein